MSDLSQEILGLQYHSDDRPLNEKDLNANPFIQFEEWFKEAMKADPDKANAFVLSTATKEGKPSARVVLLKGVENEGFVFYTNYDSRKGRELTENSFAAITFFWPLLDRQVRVEGKVEKVSGAVSDEYFKRRAMGSQAGAWISPQSSVIPSRDVLEKKHHEFIKEHENQKIERPPFWGGFSVIPCHIEFWQGRKSRLHDRFLYTFENNNWKIERLAP